MDRTETSRMEKLVAVLGTLGYVDTVEVDRERGRAVVVFEAGPRHINEDNAVQGGIVTGWLDVAMASAVFAANGSGTRLASLEIKTTFLRPVRPGRPIRVEGWVLRMGRTTAFLEGRVIDDADQVLATASSTAAVRTGQPAAPAPAGTSA